MKITFLGDQNFIKQLVNFDKDNMSDRVLKKIGQQYVAHSEFMVSCLHRVQFHFKTKTESRSMLSPAFNPSYPVHKSIFQRKSQKLAAS